MNPGRAPFASLRPYLPSDAALCAAIFRAAIEELTVDDYSEDQREAWASRGDDVDALGARLADMLTLVAIAEGGPVGFASLKGDVVDMLFVAPAVARRGVGAMLLDALVKLACGAWRQETDQRSQRHCARDFRTARLRRRSVAISCARASEWLANTTMVKPLTAPDPGRASSSKLH